MALAVLMPVVASMGGIAGSQTLTLTIRGLALDQIATANVRWLTRKELAVGALNGLVWAVVVSLAAYAWFRDPGLSAVIGAAMMLNDAQPAGGGPLRGDRSAGVEALRYRSGPLGRGDPDHCHRRDRFPLLPGPGDPISALSWGAEWQGATSREVALGLPRVAGFGKVQYKSAAASRSAVLRDRSRFRTLSGGPPSDPNRIP